MGTEDMNDIQNQIANLTLELSSSHSPTGDWKINKIYEYRMLGKEDPYDFEELAAARQAIRDKINELQAQQAQMDAATENGVE